MTAQYGSKAIYGIPLLLWPSQASNGWLGQEKGFSVNEQPAVVGLSARVLMRFGPFLAIALLLFLAWIGGFVVFHIAGSLIHLLLLIAIISLVIHFFTGSRTA